MKLVSACVISTFPFSIYNSVAVDYQPMMYCNDGKVPNLLAASDGRFNPFFLQTLCQKFLLRLFLIKLQLINCKKGDYIESKTKQKKDTFCICFSLVLKKSIYKSKYLPLNLLCLLVLLYLFLEILLWKIIARRSRLIRNIVFNHLSIVIGMKLSPATSCTLKEEMVSDSSICSAGVVKNQSIKPMDQCL